MLLIAFITLPTRNLTITILSPALSLRPLLSLSITPTTCPAGTGWCLNRNRYVLRGGSKSKNTWNTFEHVFDSDNGCAAFSRGKFEVVPGADDRNRVSKVKVLLVQVWQKPVLQQLFQRRQSLLCCWSHPGGRQTCSFIAFKLHLRSCVKAHASSAQAMRCCQKI